MVRGAAVSLGIAGWVRHRPDGNLEVRAEGSAEQLDELLKRVRDSSTYGRFDAIVEDVPVEDLTGFETH